MYCNEELKHIKNKINELKKEAKKKSLHNLVKFLEDEKCFCYFINNNNSKSIEITKFVYQIF